MPDYGARPTVHGIHRLEFTEFMHWLYCPVYMPGQGLKIPENLSHLGPLIGEVLGREMHLRPGVDLLKDHYIYVTARHGFATPGNPLNRPGWHADGFGTQDINWIWTDKYPTRFAVQKFGEISRDHNVSAEQFELQVMSSCVVTYPLQTLLRLDPYVVHAVPEIKVGGERSFVKISFSKDRYNLRGNSHNHAFDYDWKMWARDELRNDPAFAGGDSRPDR